MIISFMLWQIIHHDDTPGPLISLLPTQLLFEHYQKHDNCCLFIGSSYPAIQVSSIRANS